MLQQALLAIGTQIVSIIGGALRGAWGSAIDIMQSGAKAALQFHQEGISLARDLGMGLNQANAYTKVLTERTQVLAQKYGVAASAITAVQRNISEATGKQLLLNNAQAEGFVQANKLVGQETTSKFMDTIINGMGGQVSTVQGAISKAYATAAKQGLNAQKFSKTVAENLSMANRLNFRNGIDGITRMAAMAEKFGLSMKSVETAAGQFMEFDSAIEHSAHLQMLGGSIGASFGNPLENMYESMYDPEAFAKRMEDAMKGMATFDAKKGYATMSPMNQEILKNYAKEMGLNAEEVVANAKKMAEVRYKETRFAPELDRYSGNGQDKEARRNFILNNSQVTPEGQLQVNGKNINEITKEEWDNMMAFDGKSDTDILKDQALRLKSIDEALTGNAASVAAAFAKGLALDKNAQNIIQNIDKAGTKIQGVAENLGRGANEALTKMLNWINDNGPFLKSIADNVIGVSKFLADNWGKLLIAIAGWKLLLKPALGANLGGAAVGGRLGARALGGLSTLFQKTKGLKSSISSFTSGMKDYWNWAKANRTIGHEGFIKSFSLSQNKDKNGNLLRWVQNSGKKAVHTNMWKANSGPQNIIHSLSSLKNIATAPKRLVKGAFSGAKNQFMGHWKKARAFGKATMVGGAVAGAVGGIGDVVGALSNYKKTIEDINNSHLSSEEKRKAIEEANAQRNSEIGGGVGEAVGGVVGAFFGPIGAFIGPVVGKFIGSFIGQYWNPIVNGVKSLFSGIINGIKYVGGVIWDGIKFLIDNNPIGLMVKGIGKIFGKDWSITKGLSAAKDWIFGGEKQADGGIVGAKPKETLIEKHDIGGIVGGNSYSGDKILTGLNSGEMVLNKGQQSALFNFINNMPSVLSKIGANGNVSYYNAVNRYNSVVRSTSMNQSYNEVQADLLKGVGDTFSSLVKPSTLLENSNDVKAKPVGEKEYIYVPSRNNAENGVKEINVKDINLNLNGTLKLDGGTSTKNLDINQLLNETSFISSLKDMIKQSINNDINNGRFMSDIASMRGMPSQVGLWGNK